MAKLIHFRSIPESYLDLIKGQLAIERGGLSQVKLC
jgi:hypothetical protein